MMEHHRILLHHRQRQQPHHQEHENEEDCSCLDTAAATTWIVKTISKYWEILYRRLTVYYHPRYATTPTKAGQQIGRHSSSHRGNQRSLRLGLGVDTSLKASDRDNFVVLGGNVLVNYTTFEGGIEATWDEWFYYVELDGKGVETLYVIDESGATAGRKLKSALVYYFPKLSSESITSIQTEFWTVDDVARSGGYPARLSFATKAGVIISPLSLYMRDPVTDAPLQVPPSASGYIVPMVYVQTNTSGVISQDYLVGGLEGTVLEWNQNPTFKIKAFHTKGFLFNRLQTQNIVLNIKAYDFDAVDNDGVDGNSIVTAPNSGFDTYMMDIPVPVSNGGYEWCWCVIVVPVALLGLALLFWSEHKRQKEAG